jgi:hypothetical protein
MSKDAVELLQQFRKLAVCDQRELFSLLLRELASAPATVAPARRKSIAEVAGKHRPTPNPGAASHDADFAEAVAASKTRSIAA